MKKTLLALAISMMASVPAFAQKWGKMERTADAMINRKAATIYNYIDSTAMLSFGMIKDEQLILLTGRSFFPTKLRDGYVYQNVRFGLLDADGNLLDTIDLIMYENNKKTIVSRNQGKKVKKITKHLLANPVRVYTNLYEDVFDLTVPPLDIE